MWTIGEMMSFIEGKEDTDSVRLTIEFPVKEIRESLTGKDSEETVAVILAITEPLGGVTVVH